MNPNIFQMMEKLLTRDDFRSSVFERDGYKCIFCDQPAKDAHHILERRLWSDGGYYLSNGASVCEDHHLACERTDISVEQVREAAGINKFKLPDHMYDDQIYDKWGNPILPNGQRLKGDLFEDESVQKIIVGHLNEFTDRVKYPRTYYLPWSLNVTDDDRVIESVDQFNGKEVVITWKMDGENTTMYRDYIHARSIDGLSHISRDWVKQFHSTIAHDIPEGWRICGENLFARHSIGYDNLPSYFMGFSVWTDKNECLSWSDTLDWFELLGITPVTQVCPVGIWTNETETYLRGLINQVDWTRVEGYVVRNADHFHYKDFRRNVAKFVRKDHVQTVKHWMHGQAVIPNILAK